MENNDYMDISRNLAEFKDWLYSNLSYYFEEQTPPETESLVKRLNASFSLNRQTFAEPMMQELLKIFKVKTLAGYKSNNGSEVHYILYSERTKNKMYVIHIDSFEYGIIENINVAFFESIEEMYDYLMNILNYVEKFRGIVLEVMPRVKFKVDFYK